jgi:hypothetical protein
LLVLLAFMGRSSEPIEVDDLQRWPCSKLWSFRRIFDASVLPQRKTMRPGHTGTPTTALAIKVIGGVLHSGGQVNHIGARAPLDRYWSQ